MQVLMVGSAGALPAAVGANGEAPDDEADEVAVAARRQPKKKRRGIVGALAVRPAQPLCPSIVLRVAHAASGAEAVGLRIAPACAACSWAGASPSR